LFAFVFGKQTDPGLHHLGIPRLRVESKFYRLVTQSGRFLEVPLTVPSDTNREEAKRIIGDAALPTLQLLSIFTEARKQGIKVPD
ncbi:hypothetical protein, partial [Pseudoduganella danionis]|uniref:hypothetical protein n=1 Tax=Pseudoduganella danionis TaxID=1890295 RepID=UPI0035AFC99F